MKIPKNVKKYLTTKNLIIVIAVILGCFLLYKIYQLGIAYIMDMIKQKITGGFAKMMPGKKPF